MRNCLERAISICLDWQSVVRGWKSWHVTRGYSLVGGNWPSSLRVTFTAFTILHCTRLPYGTKGGCERDRVSHPFCTHWRRITLKYFSSNVKILLETSECICQDVRIIWIFYPYLKCATEVEINIENRRHVSWNFNDFNFDL